MRKCGHKYNSETSVLVGYISIAVRLLGHLLYQEACPECGCGYYKDVAKNDSKKVA